MEGYQIQRRFLVGIFLLFLSVGLPKPLPASDFTVTKTDDTNDGVCDSDCSLREAILAANQNSGADSIRLPGGTFILSLSGSDDTAATGDLDITGDLTVNGAGADQTVVEGSDGWTDRIFHLLSGTVTLNGMAIVGGHAADSGGGIRNEAALSLVNCDVRENISDASGGGVFNLNDLTVSGSTLQMNRASLNGGGIAQQAGSLAVTNSTFSENRAEGSGGAIYEERGSSDLQGVTITRNFADADEDGVGDGGGIHVGRGQIFIQNTLIGGNGSVGGPSPDCSGSLTSEGNNLIQDISGCSLSGDSSGDILGKDPLLDPIIGDHGGTTPTHPLLPGSPAIDAGNTGLCVGDLVLAKDQRGDERYGSCDIGAFEFGACGDGTLQTSAGEECDDGNLADGDGCSSSCLTEVSEPPTTPTESPAPPTPEPSTPAPVSEAGGGGGCSLIK